MASYHLRVKTISRGQGQSAVAAAAYRSGERLADTATGRIRHYPDRADRVRFTGIFLPFGAPVWARDRAALWNAVERIERRQDATLAREIELSLPHELTDRQRLQLVRDFVRENLVRRGLAVDVAIHGPETDKGGGGDPRNVHAHLLIAERPLGPGGFAARKDRGLQSKATLYGWRANWATLCNRYLAHHGHAARVDHRSFRARGIQDRQPTVPLGPVAAAMQRRGIVTPQGQRLAAIQARNALRQGWTGSVGEVFGQARGRRSQAGPVQAAAQASSVARGFTGAAAGATAVTKPKDGSGFRTASVPADAAACIASQPGPMPAIDHSSAGTGAGAVFKAAAALVSGAGPPKVSTASGVGASSPPFRPPKLSGAAIGRAIGSLAAVAPDRGAADAAREVCGWGPPAPGRNPSPVEASALPVDSGGEAEPCSYEAEAAAIVRRHAREIDGIRQSNMPRHLMEAAIRAVRDAQRAALAAMRERRRWRRPTRSDRRGAGPQCG